MINIIIKKKFPGHKNRAHNIDWIDQGHQTQTHHGFHDTQFKYTEGNLNYQRAVYDIR